MFCDNGGRSPDEPPHSERALPASPLRRSSLPTRRQVIAAGGTLALAGCSRQPKPEQHVAIVRAAAYGPELYDIIYRLLAELQPPVRGKQVILKPNLVEFESHTVINTHPVFVHAALEAFKRLGAASVRIAEGPGHRRITLDLAEAAGFFQIIPGFENLFTDLN